MKHNIDKNDNRTTYVRNGWFVANEDDFEPVTDKKFEIHNDDKALIKTLKNKKYGK